MKNENWQQVKQLLAQALEKDPSLRDEFLTEVCKSNLEIKKEVMALLAHEEQVVGFLSTPLIKAPLVQGPLQSQLNQQSAKPRSLEEMLISLIGETLDDKYKIEEQLGQGGMGAVFKATHLGTDRTVALKVINPQLMTNGDFVERFKREAKAAGRLSHPNVVNVTDFGFTRIGVDNIAYLVMEYLNGFTLASILAKKKTLPLEFVVDIIEQTCLAVELAHKQGIIHRDLKPDNIWLEPNERGGYNVKVLDFGVAKLKNNTRDSQEKKTSLNLVNDTKNLGLAENDSFSSTLIKGLNNLNNNSLTLSYNNCYSDKCSINPAITEIIKKYDTQEDLLPQTNVDTWLTGVGIIVGTPTYMSPE
ncbi:MAG: serine/threonine protein kinase [Acidobacteria bacterium]|nr:serine/threonine protein kinase [Acidobacteriota bacterium]